MQCDCRVLGWDSGPRNVLLRGRLPCQFAESAVSKEGSTGTGRRCGELQGLARWRLQLLAQPALADVKAGVDAWSRGDYAVAVREWLRACRSRDPDDPDVFNLAQFLRLGCAVPVDEARAGPTTHERRRQGAPAGGRHLWPDAVPGRAARTGLRLRRGCRAARRPALAVFARHRLFQRRLRLQRLGARLRAC